MGATLLGDTRLIRPGMALCTRATPAPHRPAVAISRLPVAAPADTMRSAQPSAISSKEPQTAERAPQRCSAEGASQPPTPISTMGSSVSHEKLRKSMPVAC